MNNKKQLGISAGIIPEARKTGTGLGRLHNRHERGVCVAAQSNQTAATAVAEPGGDAENMVMPGHTKGKPLGGVRKWKM